MDNPNQITITVNGRQLVQSKDEKSTLLETLERHNVETPSHCREGFCGVCRTQLLKGQVEYTLDPLAYIDDDEILPCCCRPISDIEINR